MADIFTSKVKHLGNVVVNSDCVCVIDVKQSLPPVLCLVLLIKEVTLQELLNLTHFPLNQCIFHFLNLISLISDSF